MIVALRNKISYIVLTIVLLTVLGMMSVYVLGRHTEYCPWGHVLSTTEDCIVLDRKDDRVLIQHRDIDNITNRNNYLEIIEAGQSQTYNVPESILAKNLKMELLPQKEQEAAILVSGQRQHLTSNNKIKQ